MTLARNHLLPASAETPAQGPIRVALAIVLPAWAATMWLGAAAGWFITPPGGAPLPILIAVLGPVLVFAVLYRGSASFRAFVLGLDLRLLTAFQAWRVGGVMFVVLHMQGLLPGLFAWPAGLGDFMIGLSAPLVLMAMIKGAAGWRRQAILLNLFGLLDFAGAFGTGVLASDSALGLLAGDIPMSLIQSPPLSLIPNFAVPLWIIIHVISLLQLRALRGGEAVQAA